MRSAFRSTSARIALQYNKPNKQTIKRFGQESFPVSGKHGQDMLFELVLRSLYTLHGQSTRKEDPSCADILHTHDVSAEAQLRLEAVALRRGCVIVIRDGRPSRDALPNTADAAAAEAVDSSLQSFSPRPPLCGDRCVHAAGREEGRRKKCAGGGRVEGPKEEDTEKKRMLQRGGSRHRVSSPSRRPVLARCWFWCWCCEIFVPNSLLLFKVGL